MNSSHLNFIRNMHRGIFFEENAEDKSKEKPNLSKAISDAENEADKGDEDEGKEQESKEKKTSGDDDSSDDSEDGDEDEDDLAEDERDKAVELYKALQDPDKADLIIRAMARRAGITSDSTQKETEKAEKTIEEIIEEGLGTEYKFLSKKLSTVIAKAVEFETSKKTRVIEENLRAREIRETEEKVKTSIDAVINGYEEVTTKI